jgi:hypothetical protein
MNVTGFFAPLSVIGWIIHENQEKSTTMFSCAGGGVPTAMAGQTTMHARVVCKGTGNGQKS